jgi:hypothetical protein
MVQLRSACIRRSAQFQREILAQREVLYNLLEEMRTETAVESRATRAPLQTSKTRLSHYAAAETNAVR